MNECGFFFPHIPSSMKYTEFSYLIEERLRYTHKHIQKKPLSIYLYVNISSLQFSVDLYSTFVKKKQNTQPSKEWKKFYFSVFFLCVCVCLAGLHIFQFKHNSHFALSSWFFFRFNNDDGVL